MRRLLFVLFMLSALVVYAEEKHSNSTVEKTGFSADDLSFIVKLWGISTKEALRYQEIMKGPLGKWNANIDPIMALGIYSKSDVDRKHYAELYAMQEFQLTEMTQLFSREYDKTFKALFHDAKIIDPKLLSGYYENQPQKNILDRYTAETVLNTGDRLLYFYDVDCSVCKNHVVSLERTIHEHTSRSIAIGVDIYIVNAEKEDDVRQWASRSRVNTDLVKNASMTLNVDNGLQNQLNSASNQNSSLYLLRDNKTFVVNPAQIGMSM
jgi:integrating conjugative element protein (TIGR03759 family)